jgi:hypothetical protein
MPTVGCTEHKVEFISPAEFPRCDDECREIFMEAVQAVHGCSIEQLGIEPESRLAQEAAKEASRCHRAEVIDARDVKEASICGNRPGRRDGVKRGLSGVISKFRGVFCAGQPQSPA